MKVEIRNNKNQPIGWVDDSGGNKQAMHIRKGYVGRYIKNSNITFDKAGKIYCYGDGAQCLVRDADRGYL